MGKRSYWGGWAPALTRPSVDQSSFEGKLFTLIWRLKVSKKRDDDVMIGALMIALLTTAEGVPGQRSTCTPEQDVAIGKVVKLMPDPPTLKIDLKAKGLRIAEADEVFWDECSIKLQVRVYGGWAISESGVPVIPNEGHLITRDDKVPPAEAEPEHPDIPNATFVSSTSVAIGNQRAGLWTRTDGKSLIARYNTGERDQPIPMLISGVPIVGLFYLGAPDAPGGAFQFWQRLPEGKYRYIHVPWSEEGSR